MTEQQAGSTGAWLRAAGRRDVVWRSVKVSAVVGSILVAINQGNVLLSGQLTMDLYWKIPLTYCVPYGVSTYAAVGAILTGSQRG